MHAHQSTYQIVSIFYLLRFSRESSIIPTFHNVFDWMLIVFKWKSDYEIRSTLNTHIFSHLWRSVHLGHSPTISPRFCNIAIGYSSCLDVHIPFLFGLVSTVLFSVQAPLHVRLTFVYVTGQYGYHMPILSTIIDFTISARCHSFSSASLPGANEQAKMFLTKLLVLSNKNHLCSVENSKNKVVFPFCLTQVQ